MGIKSQPDEVVDKLLTLDQLSTDAITSQLLWEVKYNVVISWCLTTLGVLLFVWEVLNMPSQILTVKTIPSIVATIIGAKFTKAHKAAHARLDQIRKDRGALAAIALIKDDEMQDKAYANYAANQSPTKSFWKRITD